MIGVTTTAAIVDELDGNQKKRQNQIWFYSAVGLKTVAYPLAGTTVFKQSPL